MNVLDFIGRNFAATTVAVCLTICKINYWHGLEYNQYNVFYGVNVILQDNYSFGASYPDIFDNNENAAANNNGVVRRRHAIVKYLDIVGYEQHNGMCWFDLQLSRQDKKRASNKYQ